MSSKKILIYRLGSLGDTIIALPCFHKIKDSFPNADITLLTNKPVLSKAAPAEAVLGDNYFFNNVIDYPIGARDPRVLFQLIKQIRRQKIQTVINLTAPRSKIAARRDRWFFKFAGVKQLIGFPDNFSDTTIIDPITGLTQWEPQRLTERIAELGAIPLDDTHFWDLKLTKEELSLAGQKLSALNTSNIIAINTGTKVQANDWGAKNWLMLIERLGLILKNWELVIVGANEDVAFADECLKSWGNKGVNLCGQVTPRVSAAVLKTAKLFIGHDSGPMHLAACVDTPCVGIFSARNLPGQWYPRGNNNRIIYHQTDCAGCKLSTCVTQQKKCILSITVNEVEKAALEILNIN